MTNTLKLKAAIVESGMTQAKIAKLIGVSPYTFHKKLHNRTDFKASEIKMLSDILHIDNINDIFFAPCVELNSTK